LGFSAVGPTESSCNSIEVAGDSPQPAGEIGRSMLLPQELPGRLAERWDWQMRGLCRGADVSMFYPPDGERGRRRAQREKRAKRLCQACPVIAQCRDYALAVGEPYGVWGGMTENERRTLLDGEASLRRPLLADRAAE
jgi:WhiB family redox-sensing transcriptional regulator